MWLGVVFTPKRHQFSNNAFKDTRQPHILFVLFLFIFFFAYMREFGYYDLFGIGTSRNKRNHYETNRDN